MIAWIALRTLHPGKMSAFRRAWQFAARPAGLVRVYFLRGGKTNEMIGMSLWTSRAALSRYRRTPQERARLAAMDPLVKRIIWSGIFNAEDVHLTRSRGARRRPRTRAR
jgi:heme-degrading monooxygenase HmoA